MTRAALLLAASASLSACALGDAVNDLFDDDEVNIDPSAPRPEDRIAILTAAEALAIDPATAGPVTLPAPYVNPSWPQTGGAPTHAMQHPQGGQLARLWRRDIGEGDSRNSRITAQPVVENGRIYVMDGRGEIGAYDAETGREFWRERVRAENDRDAYGFGGGIAVGEGRVYLSSGVGLMAALDAETGALLWTLPTGTPMHSAPAYAEGQVYAVSEDNVLVAVNAATGERLWSYQGIVEPARVLSSPAPAVLNDVVVAPFGSGELWAIQATDGQPIWEDALTRAGRLAPISTLNDVAGSPVIYDDTVYAMSHSGVLAAVTMTTGERLWSVPIGGVNQPWLAGDALFVVSADAELVAFDRNTGAVKWLEQLPGFEDPEDRSDKIAWAGPALIGGRLALVSSEGEARFHDAATGAFIGNFEPGASFISPIVANQTLYVVNSDGELSAYR